MLTPEKANRVFAYLFSGYWIYAIMRLTRALDGPHCLHVSKRKQKKFLEFKARKVHRPISGKQQVLLKYLFFCFLRDLDHYYLNNVQVNNQLKI